MDPLRAAFRVAEQIPDGEKYRAEFRFCWRAVGLAALRVGDDEVYDRAIDITGTEREGAELRLAALRSRHRRSTEFARDFVQRLAEWEEVLWRSELSELAPLLVNTTGAVGALEIINGIDDAFTRTTMYSNIASAAVDPDFKLAVLRLARESASLTERGNYNYALKHVVSGFIDAGWLDLAEEAVGAMNDPEIKLDYLDRLREAARAADDHRRAGRAETEEDDIRGATPGIRSQSEILLVAETLVGMDLDEDFPSSGTLFKRVGRLLRDGDSEGAAALVREHFPARLCPATLAFPEDQLSALLAFQVRALVGYDRNDLKVEYLTDLAIGLMERGLEVPSTVAQALAADDLIRLSPPAPMSIHAIDPTTLSFDAFVLHLFNRPVARTEEDERIFNRETNMDPGVADPEALVTMTARLFREFGQIAPRYSVEQVDKAMWFLQGYPYMIFSEAGSRHVSDAAALELLTSTYHLFADYVAGRGLSDDVTSFHMIYDQMWGNDSWQPVLFETMVRVLETDDDDCRAAALHGLNHLHDRREWRASVERVIDEFLKRGGPSLAPGIIAYARECRDGRAL